MDTIVSRKMHRTLEPYHALVYLTPEAADAYTAIGLEPGRMSYFAPRAAPMGPVPADVVIATFFGFSPAVVRPVIPEAWARAAIADVLDARLALVDAALRRILGDDVVTSSDVKDAATLARRASDACTPEGRALYAGHASLPTPDEPHLALWHSLTLLREYRGDGHNAAQAAVGVEGCDAMVMHHATGEIPKFYADSRGWEPDEWAASQERLRGLGWLDGAGALTESGRETRQWVEDRTDELALRCWERLGEDDATRLRHLVRPFTRRIADETFGAFRSDN
jgi:hypothetical protein